MQKQIEEEKARVKAQHDLYEHVRSERNRFAKLQVYIFLAFVSFICVNFSRFKVRMKSLK